MRSSATRKPATKNAMWYGVFAVGLILTNAWGSFAAQANKANITNSQLSDIKTEFASDAQLSPAELKQVEALALKCGIPDVERVTTFHCLPSTHRSVSATSKERNSGRTITYDVVFFERVDWDSPKPEADAKRLGAFWVRKPYLTTIHLREFTISNQTVRVAIGKGINIPLADKVIPLIVSGKVRFEDEWCRREFEELDLSKLAAISAQGSGNEYQLRYDRPNRIIFFKMEQDEVVVTRIASWWT